jgi:hypothetical protein
MTANHNSAWRDHNDADLQDIRVSTTEYSLLQRLRRLGGGTHLVLVVKERGGRDGMEQFRVTETVLKPTK